MTLDKNALAAARGTTDEAYWAEFEKYLAAYLAALPTTSVSEPVAWTSQSNIDGLRNHDSFVIGSIVNKPNDSMCIPVFLASPAPSEPVSHAMRWLTQFLDVLRQNPHRYADDIDGLERVASALTAAEARAAEAEKALEALERNCVPLSADGRSVFIDGTGDVDLDWKDERLKRAEAAEAKIAELEHRSLAEGRPTHRHKKRGTEYVLIGYGKMQAESWFERNRGGNTFTDVDMREVAIYRPVDDGSLWARPREEFEDGRFEVLPQPPEAK